MWIIYTVNPRISVPGDLFIFDILVGAYTRGLIELSETCHFKFHRIVHISVYNNAFINFRDVLFQDHEAWTIFFYVNFVETIKHQRGLRWQNQDIGIGGLIEGAY